MLNRISGIEASRETRAEIVFILDASGSMSGLESDTIGGFNGMIRKNLDEPGEATVSTVLFSDRSHVLHDRLDIREVPALTSKDYRCSGCTALLDAIGGAIKHIDLVQGILPREYRADSVLFVITTDGMENASRNYSLRKVRHMIERHQEMGWEFLFIGANIDAIGEAGRLGIAREHAVDYLADAQGTAKVYEAAACAVSNIRLGAPVAPGWKSDIEQDMKTRGKR